MTSFVSLLSATIVISFMHLHSNFPVMYKLYIITILSMLTTVYNGTYILYTIVSLAELTLVIYTYTLTQTPALEQC